MSVIKESRFLFPFRSYALSMTFMGFLIGFFAGGIIAFKIPEVTHSILKDSISVTIVLVSGVGALLGGLHGTIFGQSNLRYDKGELENKAH